MHRQTEYRFAPLGLSRKINAWSVAKWRKNKGFQHVSQPAQQPRLIHDKDARTCRVHAAVAFEFSKRLGTALLDRDSTVRIEKGLLACSGA
jgi:hypothetical protein